MGPLTKTSIDLKDGEERHTVTIAADGAVKKTDDLDRNANQKLSEHV